MYVIPVAFRFLRKRPISWMAAAITMLIVILYLLIISVMEGFKALHMDSLQSVQAHMTVQAGSIARGMWHPEKWAEEVAAVEGVKGVTIGLEIPAIAIFDESRTIGALRGVDLDRELALGRMRELISPKDLSEFGVHDVGGKTLRGCIVGGMWKRRHNLKTGDHVTFLFTDEEGDPRPVAFRIVGFFEGKDPYYENAAFVDRAFLAEKLGIPGQAKTLSVWVAGDPDRPDLDEIRSKVKGTVDAAMARDVPHLKQLREVLEVETWREKGDNWYQAITRENQIMRFIMGIFLVFVVIIIMLILSRMVAEKVRDIGVLRAMGATPRGILALFLVQGLSITLAGLAVGLPLAVLLTRNLNELEKAFQVNIFPKAAFLIETIPSRLLPQDVVLIVVLTLGAGFLGALYPAWKASRLDPVECLRHE